MVDLKKLLIRIKVSKLFTIIIKRTYRSQFRILWKELLNKNLAKNSLDIIENENIFKFSPYNALTGEQMK